VDREVAVMLRKVDHFQIGDRLKLRSKHRLCEVMGFIRGWPFGYFKLRYEDDGSIGKVSVGNARKRFDFVSRPVSWSAVNIPL
jgi:hypothetical protein